MKTQILSTYNPYEQKEQAKRNEELKEINSFLPYLSSTELKIIKELSFKLCVSYSEEYKQEFPNAR